MTLNDLTEQLSPNFPASVQKDLKTAVRVLAQSLKYADAKSCPLEACLKPLPELYQVIETSLTSQGKSPHTIRNTKNNLSRLFRLATTKDMFSPLPPTLSRYVKRRDIPPRTNRAFTRMDGSHLPRAQWPTAVDAEFARFSQWATDPLVHRRPASWRKRPITMKHYERTFDAYFGYLHHELGIHPVQFSHLYDFTLVERFVYWHINEKWHRPTYITFNLLKCVRAMASQYQLDAALVESIKVLQKRLPPLRPVYNKSEVWVPLAEIERVGLALWPSKPPEAFASAATRPESIGRQSALRACASLMLRLWVHIPYRQRNMREMKMDQNLYRREGQWRIRFANEELKVASKRGQSNVFDLPFPPTLIQTLEAYLTTWRPILARIENAPEVFLNQYGRAIASIDIRRNLQGHIYAFTGRHWHPHMMRTVWTTEWILSSGDFITAAIMLNDRLETVIGKYSHLRDQNVAENAYLWVQNRVNHH